MNRVDVWLERVFIACMITTGLCGLALIGWLIFVGGPS